jgi:hypothetical protein
MVSKGILETIGVIKLKIKNNFSDKNEIKIGVAKIILRK